jgi:hypothetical protein
MIRPFHVGAASPADLAEAFRAAVMPSINVKIIIL